MNCMFFRGDKIVNLLWRLHSPPPIVLSYFVSFPSRGLRDYNSRNWFVMRPKRFIRLQMNSGRLLSIFPISVATILNTDLNSRHASSFRRTASPEITSQRLNKSDSPGRPSFIILFEFSSDSNLKNQRTKKSAKLGILLFGLNKYEYLDLCHWIFERASSFLLFWLLYIYMHCNVV